MPEVFLRPKRGLGRGRPMGGHLLYARTSSGSDEQRWSINR